MQEIHTFKNPRRIAVLLESISRVADSEFNPKTNQFLAAGVTSEASWIWRHRLGSELDSPSGFGIRVHIWESTVGELPRSERGRLSRSSTLALSTSAGPSWGRRSPRRRKHLTSSRPIHQQ
jgi:hypothetical protein